MRPTTTKLPSGRRESGDSFVVRTVLHSAVRSAKCGSHPTNSQSPSIRSRVTSWGQTPFFPRLAEVDSVPRNQPLNNLSRFWELKNSPPPFGRRLQAGSRLPRSRKYLAAPAGELVRYARYRLIKPPYFGNAAGPANAHRSHRPACSSAARQPASVAPTHASKDLWPKLFGHIDLIGLRMPVRSRCLFSRNPVTPYRSRLPS